MNYIAMHVIQLFKNVCLFVSLWHKRICTYFVLCGIARDDHGHDIQTISAASQAVDRGDVGTFVIH